MDIEQALQLKKAVIWKEGDNIVIWKPRRTPALAWNELTLLEALCDSAQQLLVRNNLQDCEKRLAEMLKILRSKIERSKKQNPQTLLHRCEYRETKRTRCNFTPVKLHPSGKYLCDNHYKKTNNSNHDLKEMLAFD